MTKTRTRPKSLHELAEEIANLIDDPKPRARRSGKNPVAHLTPGEVVIPTWLMTPQLLAEIYAAARTNGIDPARFVVGDSRNSINPQTGNPEFFDPSGTNANPQTYCELPDGRVVPYADEGFGYGSVSAGGGNINPNVGVGVGAAVAPLGMETENKPRTGIAGGGRSGNLTSLGSRMLRDLTGSARRSWLKPISGTRSVGGTLAKGFPALGGGLMLLDALVTKGSLDDAPICKPLA